MRHPRRARRCARNETAVGARSCRRPPLQVHAVHVRAADGQIELNAHLVVQRHLRSPGGRETMLGSVALVTLHA